MKNYIVLLSLILISFQLDAQNYIIPLYNGPIPNAKTSEVKERVDTSDIVRYSHVQAPLIEVYLPAIKNRNGQGVVICPGGGYAILAYNWEGSDIAKFLNGKGIAGIVLKYRLPDDDSNIDPEKSPLMDAQKAIEIVRDHAKEWGLDPAQIGIMGFSAGGHLASTAGTHFTADNRPDFMVLGYPVVSFDAEITHMGSRNNLIGENPSQELIEYYSNELQVSDDTPPTFIVHSLDDKAVPVENSLRLLQKLKEHNVPAEMHLYPYGGHGFGLAIGQGQLAEWPELMVKWMKSLVN